MCFNVIIMTKIKIIETNIKLDWLLHFHTWMAAISLILASLHYPLVRYEVEFERIQISSGTFGWASLVIVMVLAIIFMSNSLVRISIIRKLRASAYKRRFRYNLNTLIRWIYHKLIRRLRSINNPYIHRKSSWDDVSKIVEGGQKDRKWALNLLKQTPSLYPCLQCGVCTSECPVSKVTMGKYNPRRNILATLLGYKDLLLNRDDLAIWGCTDCHTCDEVCPQSIELTDLFASLKNQSIALGKGPDYIIEQAKTIFDNAKAIPSQPAIERRRQELGLPAVLEPNISEVQKLLTNLGIKDKLELRT
jgi:heterodisulfide reductase subunit C